MMVDFTLVISAGSKASKGSSDSENHLMMKKECARLKHELKRAQKSIEKLKQGEKELITR